MNTIFPPEDGHVNARNMSSIKSVLNQCTVQTFTESVDNRCCVITIFPPEDGHVSARNMSRIKSALNLCTVQTFTGAKIPDVV